jgi:hypothetical protein
MGDVNAEFGKEKGYSPKVGKHSLNKKTDDNGWRRIDFARARSMAVSTTSLEHETFIDKGRYHQVVYL